METKARWIDSFSQIPREAWSSLVESVETPIFSWEWLEALESSGSVSPRHGWTPKHLTLWRGEVLAAAAPLYLKTHSMGEFVYDFGFAQAAARYGRNWYPKLVGMSPVTPSIGFRFLVRPGEEAVDPMSRIWEEIEAFCRKEGVKSLQFNFADPGFVEALLGSRTGLLAWKHQSYLWERGGDRTFEDYLARFDKNQRRNIKREVASLEAQGVEIRMVEGPDIPEAWFPLMGELYEKTNAQFGPWAARFLTPRFFQNLDRIRPLLVFGAAFHRGDTEPFALSFLLKKGRMLIGRYWGSRDQVPNLYFNICYYKPIAYALEQGLDFFDPGAGSELKLRRGFRAVENHSLHRFFDPDLETLFAHFVNDLNQEEEQMIQAMNQSIPFKS